MSQPSVEERLSALERDVEDIKDAFLVTKSGKPDYAGHNRDHDIRLEASKTFNTYKVEATKKLVGALAGLVIVVFGVGLIEYAKKLFGLH